MSKPITKEDLGNMLHKYINPLYERMDKFEGTMNTRMDKFDKRMDAFENTVNTRMDKFDKRMDAFENTVDTRMDKFESIQLGMENKLVDGNKLLHDRDDAHDKAIKDHEMRISIIENTPGI